MQNKRKKSQKCGKSWVEIVMSLCKAAELLIFSCILRSIFRSAHLNCVKVVFSQETPQHAEGGRGGSSGKGLFVVAASS